MIRAFLFLIFAASCFSQVTTGHYWISQKESTGNVPVDIGSVLFGSNAFTSTALVPQTTTVNSHALTGNVVVSASDITTGAFNFPAASSSTVPFTINLANGQSVDSFVIKNSAGSPLFEVSNSGSILTGNWSGSTIGIGAGGSGTTGSGYTSKGVLYYTGTIFGTTSAGTNGQALTFSSLGLPQPGAISLASGSAGISGTLALGNGGTGQTTAQAAINSLMAASGALSQGDIFYYNGTNVVRLAAGTSGNFLETQGAGANPVWAAASGGASLSANNVWTANGALSSPAADYNGTWITGGSSTTTKPQLLIEPAGTASTNWSTSGTGLGINAPSGFGGNLLDLQVAGTPVFQVANTGGINMYLYGNNLMIYDSFGGSLRTSIGMGTINTGNLQAGDASFCGGGINNGRTGVSLSNSAPVQWSSDNTWYGTVDTALKRNAAGVVEVNNGTPGTFADLKLRLTYPKVFTVSTLPTPSQAGAQSMVSDALAFTPGSSPTGGGSTYAPVFWNGSAWVMY